MKFVAIDGKEYERDVWHPLPFIVGNKEMVPTLDEPVFVKLENGEEYWWSAWARYPARKTHWMVREHVGEATMSYDPKEEVPPEIIEAALKVDRYFQSRGITEWELCGIASRDLSKHDFRNLPEAVLVKTKEGQWLKLPSPTSTA